MYIFRISNNDLYTDESLNLSNRPGFVRPISDPNPFIIFTFKIILLKCHLIKTQLRGEFWYKSIPRLGKLLQLRQRLRL